MTLTAASAIKKTSIPVDFYRQYNFKLCEIILN